MANKKFYCSTCKKYVEADEYDFISGDCKKCVEKELRSPKQGGCPNEESEDEEE